MKSDAMPMKSEAMMNTPMKKMMKSDDMKMKSDKKMKSNKKMKMTKEKM